MSKLKKNPDEYIENSLVVILERVQWQKISLLLYIFLYSLNFYSMF
jgi:hypothetical protein